MISTTYGFFSSISAGTVRGKFYGDGSGLTNLTSGLSVLPPILSTNLMSSGIITGNLVSSFNISTTLGYISSLTVDSLSFGIGNGYINMGDIITTSVSTIQTFTSTLLTTNVQVGALSTSYGFFSSISAGTIRGKHYGDGSGLTNIAASGWTGTATTNLNMNGYSIIGTTIAPTGSLYLNVLNGYIYINTYGYSGYINTDGSNLFFNGRQLAYV